MKTNISNRLKLLMSERNLKQVDILNKTLPLQIKYNVRLAKNDLSQYVNGKVEPNQERIFILAKALDVSEAWLMGFDVPRERIDKKDNVNELINIYQKLNESRKDKVYHFAEAQLHEQNNKVVPLVGATAANPTALEYADQINDISINIEVPHNADCALVVRGNSMEPDYMDSSIVFYKRQETVENGELAIVEIDGDGVTFKKVIFDYENQQVILRSLNPDYPDRALKDEEYRIIGKVVK